MTHCSLLVARNIVLLASAHFQTKWTRACRANNCSLYAILFTTCLSMLYHSHCAHDVETTSHKYRSNVMTLHWRLCDVAWKSCVCCALTQLARKSGPTSGRQRYDVATSCRCRPDVGPTYFLVGREQAVHPLQYLFSCFFFALSLD